MLAPDQRKVLGSNPSAPKFFRDGAIGNTSGFEPENGGSNPSPGASLSVQRKGVSIVIRRKEASSGGPTVYIRFVCGEIDKDSHVLAGLFCAVRRLWYDDLLPDYELDALREVLLWFNRHLERPFDYLPGQEKYDRAICWFKPTAQDHLARAWERVYILDRNDIPTGW